MTAMQSAILVVHRDQEARQALRTLFESVGLGCTDVATPEEAIYTCEKDPVDCVITAVELNEFDGVDLAYELKAKKPGLPVFGLSEDTTRTGLFIFDSVFEHPGALSNIVAEVLKRLSRNDTSGIF